MSNPKLFSKLVENLPLSLNSIREGKYWTLVTSGFTHFGTMHFLGNMITLYAFSGVLTQIPGLPVQRLAILSFGSLISGSIGFLIYRKQRERPREIVRGIGASGMVMGLGAAAACLKPHQKFYIWGVLPVPLWLLIGGYFVFDYTSLESNSGTSHEGHLGGLAFGLLYYVVSLRMFGGVLGPRAIRAAPKQMWWRGR
jgi:membrane associated rhomboid family serine protease